MTDTSIYTNSLRLVKLFGGNGGGSSGGDSIAWFYNGSTKFEPNTSEPKVFNNLTNAVIYFTEKTELKDRTPGQVVTFALQEATNWVIFLYAPSDVSDENYSNPDNWKQFGEAVDPATDVYEVLEVAK